jgi:hypothetical protein
VQILQQASVTAANVLHENSATGTFDSFPSSWRALCSLGNEGQSRIRRETPLTPRRSLRASNLSQISAESSSPKFRSTESSIFHYFHQRQKKRVTRPTRHSQANQSPHRAYRVETCCTGSSASRVANGAALVARSATTRPRESLIVRMP